MNEKPKGTTIPKQRLNILHAELDVPYSQGTKFLDRLKVVNLSLPDDDPLAGKELRMTVFNKDLKAFICGKTLIVADVEERPRPETDYGPDRTIVQVYDDQGNPVSRKQAGGGGSWKRSLEDDLVLEGVKRRSIEGQTAVAAVGNVLTCSMPIPGENLGIDEAAWKRILAKYWKAVEKGLDNYLNDDKALARTLGNFPHIDRPIQKDTSKPAQKPQDKQQTAPTPAAVVNDTPPPDDPIKHVGDLLTRANKIGVNPAGVAEALGIEKVQAVGNLEEAWKKVQEYAKKKEPNKPSGVIE